MSWEVSDKVLRRCAEYVKDNAQQLKCNPKDNFVSRIMQEVLEEYKV